LATATETKKHPETYSELVAAFRQVLGEMEVWMHFGSTTNFSSDGGGGAVTGGNRPPGDEYPPAERWRDEWNKRGDRVNVWKEAEADLKRLRFGPPPEDRPEIKPETLDELHARIVQEGANCSIREVERTLKVSSTIIRTARRRAGVTADYGRTRKLVKAKNNREYAQQLAAIGYTDEQISLIVEGFRPLGKLA